MGPVSFLLVTIECIYKINVSLTVCTVQPLLLRIVCWYIFWSTVWHYFDIKPITNFYDYQPVSDELIDVASSSTLHFHYNKIDILSLVALCCLYIPKIIKFVHASVVTKNNESWPIWFGPPCRFVLYIIRCLPWQAVYQTTFIGLHGSMRGCVPDHFDMVAWEHERLWTRPLWRCYMGVWQAVYQTTLTGLHGSMRGCVPDHFDVVAWEAVDQM